MEYTQLVESLNSDDLLRLFMQEWDKFQSELNADPYYKNSIDEPGISYTEKHLISFGQYLLDAETLSAKEADLKDVANWRKLERI